MLPDPPGEPKHLPVPKSDAGESVHEADGIVSGFRAPAPAGTVEFRDAPFPSRPMSTPHNRLHRMRSPLAFLALLLLPAAAAAPSSTPPPPIAAVAAPSADDLTPVLARAAPAADREVLRLATLAMACAQRQPGVEFDPDRLAVIDYSRPSTEPRLWIFDLEHRRLLHEEWVAHGRNSGENLTARFSNRSGSYMSSLGAFVARETYVGGNGYSLRLDGLEPGFNDRARERAIVIHGAPYVDPQAARLQGRLGRSLGCPAVRPKVAHALIDSLRGGAFVFAYYPDREWLDRSRLLACGEGEEGATARAQGRSVQVMGKE